MVQLNHRLKSGNGWVITSYSFVCNHFLYVMINPYHKLYFGLATLANACESTDMRDSADINNECKQWHVDIVRGGVLEYTTGTDRMEHSNPCGTGRILEKVEIYPHDDVIKWKYFPCYWPFVRGIHRSTVNSPHKGQWHGALTFPLTCAWINGWVNNWEAGDLGRHRAHYEVTVMLCLLFLITKVADGI